MYIVYIATHSIHAVCGFIGSRESRTVPINCVPARSEYVIPIKYVVPIKYVIPINTEYVIPIKGSLENR
jgi:hypothetical protein